LNASIDIYTSLNFPHFFTPIQHSKLVAQVTNILPPLYEYILGASLDYFTTKSGRLVVSRGLQGNLNASIDIYTSLNFPYFCTPIQHFKFVARVTNIVPQFHGYIMGASLDYFTTKSGRLVVSRGLQGNFKKCRSQKRR
jgi:hypothetical protein